MVAQAAPAQEQVSTDGLPKVAWRLFQLFSTLAVLSLAIYAAGHFYGKQLARTGYSTSTAPFEIVIANDVFRIPANMIRTEEQRVGGITKRVDLQVHWPTKTGYSAELAPAFNDTDPSSVRLVMISITERNSLLTMNDRFEPVYMKAFVEGSQKAWSNGLYSAQLDPDYGYVNEALYYTRKTVDGAPAFTARCQDAAQGSEPLLLACETDRFTGITSEIRVRFPKSMLAEWEAFSNELPEFIDSLRLR